MSRKLIDPLPHSVVARQRRAADPESSVWVEANAGSGKTYVLTRRVLRLLLAGVRPEEILCLTYTKAAAAEMRKRVSEVLAEWTVLADDVLQAALSETTGGVADRPQLHRARTLFAHALETPGGLKIVTIHAFCEAVLHRFPVEAGVPFDFSVIEDHEREAMVLSARETVLAGGLTGAAETAAVETLFEMLSDSQIADAIGTALADSRKLRSVLADRDGAKRRLRELAGARPGESRAEILASAVEDSLFPQQRWAELFAHLPPDPDKTQRLSFCERLYRLREKRPNGLALFEAYLKESREPYKDRCIARITDQSLAGAIGAEHDRLASLYPLYHRAALVERSEALLDVLGAIATRYEAEKRARSLLDFDDLVERLARLLNDGEQGPWVRYKLDAGITHILVDESQDTNREQWEVVKALAGEFFGGEGAVRKPRTLFAVGDNKQSIYSFQGADPRLFGASGREFEVKAGQAKLKFVREPLQTSFRTLPGILEAVDKVFADDVLRAAVMAPPNSPVHHDTARDEPGGRVTLWPPVQDRGDEADPDNWPTDVPLEVRSAPRQVAERIAREIATWVASGRSLGPRRRAVRPEDVLILVQSRSSLFREIIRALIRERLPTPGADRLAVTGHIGVLDLLALGDVLLNPADDLQLAALLRSPLLEVSEDDLFATAQPRPEDARLWEAMAASSLPAIGQAHERLQRWRGRLDFERPFEFFAQILYAEGGLKRFHARLGNEVDDVFAEFLDLALAHEQTSQPSLQGFLAAMRARDVTIKRELAETGGGVRVMTVHGAKGLEAPIIILADAASKQDSKLGKPVYVVADAPGPLLIHASSRSDHIDPETLDIRRADERNQKDEYWRKLYVGMTRAEDELYVTGTLTRNGTLKDTWYEAIERALRAESELVTIEGEERALIYPRVRPEPEPVIAGPDAPAPATRTGLELPDLPHPVHIPLVRPSSAFVPADAARALETSAEAVIDAELARRKGMALHALLQHLSKLPQADRQQVAGKALDALLPEFPSEHDALTRRVLSVLNRPDLAHLFGPDSRAEVPFLANASRSGVPVRLVGRIDRLVVAPGRVLVVDFKSDASATMDPAAVPPAYLTQLGLYALVATQLFPHHEVDAAILWTELESLLKLPREVLAEAAGTFTMR
ncbi:MAG: double-strand break repair helicase AddA [Devosia sp.]|nr:double-strand break repair helicase AddA [Devosia sp.]